MRVEKQTTVLITLELNESETQWLNSFVQNGPPNESEEDREMRSQFFKATDISENQFPNKN